MPEVKAYMESKCGNINVLLVEDDSMCEDIVGLMKSMFKVVTVKHPYDALDTLGRKMGGFDVVISDAHTPDIDGFQLQRIIAHEFQLPAVVMYDEKQEAIVAGLGMQNGSLSFIRKPVSTNDLIHLWRFISAQKKNCKATSSENLHDVANIGNPAGATAKNKLEWTLELHSKFMNAVKILGHIENAVPSQILRLMNVPGLTRANVASHLQKVRQLKITGPERMNKNAIFHLQYLLNHQHWNANSGGFTIIQDDWSHFLTVCNHLRHSSSSNNNNNNVSSLERNINVVARNNNQTEASFAENENLQVEGSSYLQIPEIHYLHIGENIEDNNNSSLFSVPLFEGEINIYSDLDSILDLPTSDHNTVGLNNSGGNHYMRIGNEYATNYSYGSDESEPWHDYSLWGGQPPLQQQVNGDISFGSQQPETFQQNFNQQYSFPTQRDGDDDFVDAMFASNPCGGAGNGDR